MANSPYNVHAICTVPDEVKDSSTNSQVIVELCDVGKMWARRRQDVGMRRGHFITMRRGQNSGLGHLVPTYFTL